MAIPHQYQPSKSYLMISKIIFFLGSSKSHKMSGRLNQKCHLFRYHLNPNTDSVRIASLFLEVFRNHYFILSTQYIHSMKCYIILPQSQCQGNGHGRDIEILLYAHLREGARSKGQACCSSSAPAATARRTVGQRDENCSETSGWKRKNMQKN